MLSAPLALDEYNCTVGHFDVSVKLLNVIIGSRARACHFIGYFRTQDEFYEVWLRLKKRLTFKHAVGARLALRIKLGSTVKEN